MKLFGVGYGQVLEVYAEFPNRIKSWTRVAPERVTPQYNALGTEVIGYQLDGKNVPLTGVNAIIAFPAGDGILSIGGRTIRTLGSSADTTIKNLNPETTLGDISYRSSTANTNTRLALGTTGQRLSVNAAGNAPEWQTPIAFLAEISTGQSQSLK